MIDETELVSWLREEDARLWDIATLRATEGSSAQTRCMAFSEAYRSVLAWIANHHGVEHPTPEDSDTVSRIVDHLEHQIGMAMSRREDTLSDMEAYGAMCVVTTLLSIRHWIDNMTTETSGTKTAT
jgi:hypothetical protein